MVKTIYQPPQIADDEELGALVTKYMTDYRRVYIEHPRVRYDGVYIAVCHYMYVLRSPISMLFVLVEDSARAVLQSRRDRGERLGERAYDSGTKNQDSGRWCYIEIASYMAQSA